MRRTEVLVDDLDHPEGVAWDPSSGVLWAGGEAGQLYRIDLETRTWSEEARLPGFVLGLAVDDRGRLAVCCGEAVCLYDGAVRALRDGFTNPNYPAFAPDGTLYFSDSGHWARDNGRVYRLGVDGALDVFSDGLPHFPNGCAVSPDGRYLWIVESYRPTLSRFDLATGEPEEVTALPGTVPDGVALTVEGGIVVACYRPDSILYVDPSGAVETIVEDPQGTLLSAPTNVVFVGPERDRLVSANLGRWHLTLVDPGLHGVALHHPESWGADAHG